MSKGLMHFKAAVPGIGHCEPTGEVRLGGIVNYYRLYLLNAPDGRFVGFEEIEASDDVEAVRRAQSFAGHRPLELWCGSRKIRSIPAATSNGA